MLSVFKFFSFLFIIGWPLAGLCGVSEKSNDELFVGVSYLRENQIYLGDSSRNLLFPYIKMRKSFWRLDTFRLRANFLDEESYVTGLQIKYHLNGHESKSSRKLSEEPDRNNSVLIGGYYIQKFLQNYLLGFDVDRTILGAEGATIISASLQRHFDPMKEMRLIPFAEIQFVDSVYVDYYYGLHFDKYNDLEYQGLATFNFKIGINFIYSLEKDWYLHLRGIYTKYGPGIVESPIVAHGQIVQWVTSLVFEI